MKGLRTPFLIIVWLIYIPNLGASERWTFQDSLAIEGPAQPGIFHHLEGSGRRHIAINGQHVAVVWEDNRSGNPQVYLAVKRLGDLAFTEPLAVSTGSSAYEPAIAAAGKQSFIMVYEQDSAVHSRTWSPEGLQPEQQLSASAIDQAGHASIAAKDNRLAVVWREQKNRRYRLRVISARMSPSNLKWSQPVSVEEAWLDKPVIMPSIIHQQQTMTVAWEDRRAGHTRLLVSHATLPGRNFSAPTHLNEFYSNRNEYDMGNGVTRVALAPFAEDEVIAAWMDKRRRGRGYGIFAALGYDRGAEFGPDERVHSEHGDKLPHYNPAVAGNPQGEFVVAWDDYRNGNLDIWLSAYNDEDEWSEDFSPAPASGVSEQSHPSLAFGTDGSLHMVWVERTDMLAPTRLWYSQALPAQSE